MKVGKGQSYQGYVLQSIAAEREGSSRPAFIGRDVGFNKPVFVGPSRNVRVCRKSVRKSLGRPGNPQFWGPSFTLELPTVYKHVFASRLADQRKPCFVPMLMKSHYSQFDMIPLTEAGVKLRDTPNAGGASVHSEVMSIETLQRAFDAELKASEMEVQYWPRNGSITDFVCAIGGEVLGVSVTRAFHFKGDKLFRPEDARRLLTKKLQGVLNSTQTVLFPEFRRQILHVWCKSKAVAEIVEEEYYKLKGQLRANTILVATVCSAEWLYNERSHTIPVKKQKPPKPRCDPQKMKHPPLVNGRKARKARQRHSRTLRLRALTAVQYAACKFYITTATTLAVFLLASLVIAIWGESQEEEYCGNGGAGNLSVAAEVAMMGVPECYFLT
eukprot:TRINITY_DN8387_c3_g1_i2.p1 TRINITY_DN8387_c3_g1~~TRINITY_DN8387_c3_g1_i2.p1  ORF type:complete len:385 (+),score=61.43 TRINITY_DN8387_c3_g1_i2:256-1410(+)